MQDIRFQPVAHFCFWIPWESYSETVHFYQNILLLDVEEIPQDHERFKLFTIQLAEHKLAVYAASWITHASFGFALQTAHLEQAKAYLAVNEVKAAADFEAALPSSTWIQDPAGNTLVLQATSPEKQD